MLRRTAEKAFGRGTSAPADLRPAPRETKRRCALDDFFDELYARLATSCAPGPAASSSDEEEHSTVRLSQPRAFPHGLEFVLAGPRGVLRFIHTLEAWIRVEHAAGSTADGPTVDDLRAEATWTPLEVLSVHPHAGGYRPARKPLAGRSPFFFSSTGDLARAYLDKVGFPESISKIDTL